ncbi:hypothetical protein ACSESS_00690 [Pseudomonas aeruginosa]
MSSLLFYTDSEEAIVATDTLVTELDGTFLHYTRKAIPIPARRMIIAGTGLELFITQWFTFVNEQDSVADIDSFDKDVPQVLKAIWREVERHLTSPHNYTATIYHFGFSGKEGEIHGYKYSSENGFTSESLMYGLGIKPDLMNKEGIDFTTFPDCARQIMLTQIKQEALKSRGAAVYIGGKIDLLHLTRDGVAQYDWGDI